MKKWRQDFLREQADWKESDRQKWEQENKKWEEDSLRSEEEGHIHELCKKLPKLTGKDKLPIYLNRIKIAAKEQSIPFKQ